MATAKRLGLLSLLLLAVAPATASARVRFVFPVLGGATYYDDFGEARPQGPHEGNDLMARKRTPVVACADGVVTLHRSPRAGYMLYLRNRRNEFLYIHLNNDIRGDDDRGGPKTAYAPGLRTGMHVKMGQVIGYVGNSGDAKYAGPHLHFEYHTASGRVLDPYRHLLAAPVLLFGAARGSAARIAPVLRGRLAWLADMPDGSFRVALRLRSLQTAPGIAVTVRRLVILRVPAAVGAPIAAAVPGAMLRVETEPRMATLQAQLMLPGVFTAQAILRLS
jgi:hypothetical protein